jgi:hypothetical protein
VIPSNVHEYAAMNDASEHGYFGTTLKQSLLTQSITHQAVISATGLGLAWQVQPFIPRVSFPPEEPEFYRQMDGPIRTRKRRGQGAPLALR